MKIYEITEEEQPRPGATPARSPDVNTFRQETLKYLAQQRGLGQLPSNFDITLAVNVATDYWQRSHIISDERARSHGIDVVSNKIKMNKISPADVKHGPHQPPSSDSTVQRVTTARKPASANQTDDDEDDVHIPQPDDNASRSPTMQKIKNLVSRNPAVSGYLGYKLGRNTKPK